MERIHGHGHSVGSYNSVLALRIQCVVNLHICYSDSAYRYHIKERAGFDCSGIPIKTFTGFNT
jgi:hypothetical protein